MRLLHKQDARALPADGCVLRAQGAGGSGICQACGASVVGGIEMFMRQGWDTGPFDADKPGRRPQKEKGPRDKHAAQTRTAEFWFCSSTLCLKGDPRERGPAASRRNSIRSDRIRPRQLSKAQPLSKPRGLAPLGNRTCKPRARESREMHCVA